MKANGESDAGFESFKKQYKDSLVNDGEPLVFGAGEANEETDLKEHLDLMHAAFNEKIETDVMPSFKKFDADDSGAIDKQELQQLCEVLGHPLTSEQVDEALKDLDLNGDGVIDFTEF